MSGGGDGTIQAIIGRGGAAAAIFGIGEDFLAVIEIIVGLPP